MNICMVEVDQEFLSKPAKHNVSINQEEFDFVEPPAEDFFCPVTFELLLNPHQTTATCCGHHLSEKAVDRLQLEGKPCPMCKETELVTTSDKYFKRKACAICCPHKASGCEWVGEVGGSKQHINTCPI